VAYTADSENIEIFAVGPCLKQENIKLTLSWELKYYEILLEHRTIRIFRLKILIRLQLIKKQENSLNGTIFRAKYCEILISWALRYCNSGLNFYIVKRLK
jgi:hypothetical protein